MKSFLVTFLLCILTVVTKSQNPAVEPTNFGVQMGFLGVWVHNETALSRQIALRSEIGFDGGIWGGAIYPKTGVVFAPVLTLEPRWYYNLEKRNSRSKRIDGNSGNFISLKSSYLPEAFTFSNYGSDTQIYHHISIVPTWGIRRAIGKRFTFEAGFGVGYMYLFPNREYSFPGSSRLAGNLHLRFGYRF